MKKIVSLCVFFFIFSALLDAIFILPPLPYSYDALEPYLSADLMHLHHDKHHQKYVDELNAVLKNHPELASKNLIELVTFWPLLPHDLQTVVRNNGGGHLNHSFFWLSMAPADKNIMAPTGQLAQAITQQFGSFDSFKEKFSIAAKNIFGSGWAWLCLDSQGSLIITTTYNQDNPIIKNLVPLLALDVWEHAYYPVYQNKRADYIDAWWHLVNWPEVQRRYEEALSKQMTLHNVTIIIPGISGDLSKRKIIPALYALVQKGMRGLIIGTGRRDQKLDQLLNEARPFIEQYDEAVGALLLTMMRYQKFDPEQPSGEELNHMLDVIKHEEEAGNVNGTRIVYLATPSESFCLSTRRFVESGIIEPHNNNHRIAYEKPFVPKEYYPTGI